MKSDMLTSKQSHALLGVLEERFEANMNRHKTIRWLAVQEKLEKNIEKLWVLSRMEETGGEPDVVAFGLASSDFLFCDCAPESPIQRRSLCYDEAALRARKTNKPKNSVLSLANSMQIELLTEEQYRMLQNLGEFDQKTSSWIKTPDEIRQLGGALFCDRRYNQVFVYHNSAESYYSSRGFRGLLRV